jgi:hypothetical protein
MGTAWPHILQFVMDQKTSQTVNKFFGLKFIPHAVLLDKDHKIV